ncbi:hypothetical protein ACTVZO_45225 [Streptomyces sp. IBSNAI002]
MSTTRRALGTGPRPESKAELWISAPRLLPVERAEAGALLDPADEPEPGLTRTGRRHLRAPRAGE